MTTPPDGIAMLSRRTVTLCAIAAALLLGVAVLPGTVAELVSGSAGLTVGGLPASVARGFDLWVSSGAAEPDAELSSAVWFWRVFHEVKAVLAVGLLVVLALLQGRTWAAHGAVETHGRRMLLSLAGVVGALLMALMILVAIANVQGAVAPLSSVLSFLSTTEPTPAMTSMRDQLNTGATTPTAVTLISDFRTYHAAVVACTALVGVGIAAAAALIWVRWARLPPARRRRRDLIWAELALAAMSMFIGLVLLANLTTVVNTVPALAAFFGGGA